MGDAGRELTSRVRPRIRLRFVGLVSFASRIYSLFTGLAFTIVVSRRLLVEEFGVWGYLSALAGYFLFPFPLLGYWIVRFTARGEDTGGTALVLGFLLSVCSPLLLLALSPILSAPLRVESMLLVLLAVQLGVSGLCSPFEWVSGGVKPEGIAYGSLVFETLKLLSAFLLVQVFRLGLAGAILAVTVGHLFRLIALGLTVKPYFGLGFSRRLASRVLKGVWLPFYGSISDFISSLDALLVASATGSSSALAFISAVRTVSSPVASSIGLASALYPRLLAESRVSDVEESVRLVYMLAIPECLGVITLAPYLLAILRIDYSVAAAPLAVYALGQLAFLTYMLALTTASGLEEVDLNENAGFREYVRSRLFKVANLRLVSSVVYVALLALELLALKPSSPLQVAWMWVGAYVSVTACSALYASKKLLEGLPSIKVPWRSIAAYTASALAMAAPVALLRPQTPSIEIAVLLKGIAPPIAAGALTYFAVLYVIDGWFRGLTRRTLDWMKSMLPRMRIR